MTASETNLRPGTEPPPAPPRRRFWLLHHALYPQPYIWFVFLSALDVMFTWLILRGGGGQELNVLADWIIRVHDLTGILVFKFAVVTFVLLICEVVGRRRFEAGRTLARGAVALSSVPVLVGAIHITRMACAAYAG